MADFDFIRTLLTRAHAAAPPDDIGPGIFEERSFDCGDGWQVVIFYDGGELDYIDSFIAPDGETIDPWADDLDPRIDDRRDGRYATLQNWRGCSDTEPLLETLPA